MENTTDNDRSLTIENLSPFTSYLVRVSAWTSAGEGVPSRTIVPKTGEGVPRSAPSNLKATSLSQTSIEVHIYALA